MNKRCVSSYGENFAQRSFLQWDFFCLEHHPTVSFISCWTIHKFPIFFHDNGRYDCVHGKSAYVWDILDFSFRGY